MKEKQIHKALLPKAPKSGAMKLFLLLNKHGLTNLTFQLTFARVGELIVKQGEFKTKDLCEDNPLAEKSDEVMIKAAVKYLAGGSHKGFQVEPLIRVKELQSLQRRGAPIKIYEFTARGRKLWDTLNFMA